MIERLPELLGPHAGPLFGLACVGLFVAILFEQAQLLAKYHGARRGAVATGYNNAMKLVVGNRFGAVTYFFFIALAIDSGLAAQTIAHGLAGVVAAMALANVALFAVYAHRLNPGVAALELFASHGAFGRGEKFALAGAFIAALFGYAGLTVPMIWSATHPDLRLTFANSGFLFNTVFTLVNVFLVEQRVAELIDRGNDAIRPFIAWAFVMRLLAALALVPLLARVGP
ncbi:MAG: hypothetical protein H6918_02715 [Sphingomonadaceae bacterium]|nr:hypothetical protein [Sphingomonadaceae bacterium]